MKSIVSLFLIGAFFFGWFRFGDANQESVRIHDRDRIHWEDTSQSNNTQNKLNYHHKKAHK
ncbi:hypothetical protein KC717_05480 [Candidatus Dojkabacteria bacterium]|uniref:Uncharacterized protein n=1 Tax=Candidatus Dojkabacteria bacterium TaxID=2099670 RepID=A0A955L8I3_9BACT|nr:hypothetical protein [Candidatus Dojkabacteria bacterium]